MGRATSHPSKTALLLEVSHIWGLFLRLIYIMPDFLTELHPNTRDRSTRESVMVICDCPWPRSPEWRPTRDSVAPFSESRVSLAGVRPKRAGWRSTSPPTSPI